MSQEKYSLKCRAHERFCSEVSLTAATVSAFAHAAGDHNPIHHDPGYAAASRFGRLIASGTHTSALLLGLTASYFSSMGAMVGLEFWIRFRTPIYADETIRIEWLITKVTLASGSHGELIELRGRIKRQGGQTALNAKGRILLTDQL